MAKIIYNQNLQIDTPTLLLKRRDFSNIGALTATEIVYKNHFNSANELSFKVSKSINGEQNHLWDKLNDYNIVCIPEYGEYFEIQIALAEEAGAYKTVTCRALAESELSQINLYDIEINTESDIARDGYDSNFPTVFYRNPDNIDDYEEIWNSDRKYTVTNADGTPVEALTIQKRKQILKSSSLLHRILEKASHYEIGNVDKTLAQLSSFYEFSISETSIYDELTGEIAQQHQCLFTFDVRPDGTRLVHAYDLCNKCNDCQYRGDFHDKCPQCGSTNFSGAHGKDTSIYISRENLAASASIESNKEELKNCFRVSGGDDLMTATVANCNPNGTNYLWSFPEEALENMPADLKAEIAQYNAKYEDCISNRRFCLDPEHTKGCNEAVSYVTSKFPDAPYQQISPEITGYDNLSQLSYELTDLEWYLKSSMMPTPTIDGQSIEDAIKHITENLKRIAVNNSAYSAEIIVNKAILEMAKVCINTALYQASIGDFDYSYQPADNKDSDGIWEGQITLMGISDKDIVKKTEKLTVYVDSNMERYLQQRLDIAMAKKDNSIRDITSMKLEYGDFCERIKYYSINYLINTKTAYDDCISIINDSENRELQSNMREKYQQRSVILDNHIKYMTDLYDHVHTLFQDIAELQKAVRNELDFAANISSDLWRVFCSYRREDSYKNDNYISDGLDNSQITAKAQELMDAAKKELFKASHLQYNITASLNNLLALKEFQPLADDFACGNWIHMMVDDKIYFLRLLSYEINFDDPSTLPVEFSTAEKIWSGISDVKSVMHAASSLSSSYSSFKQQMAKQASASQQINTWINEGINVSNTKLMNDRLTQEIIIDSNGMLCREFDYLTATYDDCQLKISRNTISLTDNNWQSAKNAIGKYHYTTYDLHDPNIPERRTAYGILADTIVGKLMLGDRLSIANNKESFSLTENGLWAANAKNTISINPNGNQLFKISKGAGNLLSLDENGNLALDGDSAVNGNLTLHGDSAVNGNLTVEGIFHTAEHSAAYLGGAIYSNEQIATISDDNFVNHKSPIPESFEQIFLETPTYLFLLNNGDKSHLGTIPQELEELLDSHNVYPQSFSPFCKDVKMTSVTHEDGSTEYVPALNSAAEPQYVYSMRYGEYTMLTVHMVQKLYRENETRRQTIADLEERICTSEDTIQALEERISASENIITALENRIAALESQNPPNSNEP
jgi:Reverse gyrase